MAYFIGNSKSIRSSKNIQKIDNQSSRHQQSVNRVVEEKLFYKLKGIKKFEMRGMYYQNLNPEIHCGAFTGFAQTDYNPYDIYAVEICNNHNELLGYTPIGNRRLSNSLNEWNNRKVFAFGWISHDDYDDRWNGSVYIPVGLTQEQVEKIKEVLKLKSDNQNQIDKKEKSTEKYFEILNRHQVIKQLIKDLNNPVGFYYSFPKNLIPSISNHLEKEKNWEKLLE